MSEGNEAVRCTWAMGPDRLPCGKPSVDGGSAGKLSYGVLPRSYCAEHVELQRTPAAK